MTTLTADSIRSSYLDSIAQIERELDGLSRTLISHNTVLRLGPPSRGLYVRVAHHADSDPTVGVTGISHCSRWERPQADKIVRTAGIKNGNDETPVAVKLHDALRQELANAKANLALFDSLSKGAN